MTETHELSALRLNVMRIVYALIAFAEGSIIWPLMFNHGRWSVMHSVAMAMLAALTVCAMLGIRYPLKALPLLIFEFAWKTIWCVAIALPLWRANMLTGEAAETFRDTFFGVVLCPIVIPWGYLWRTYIVAKGEKWRDVKRQPA
jgi:hypothetical protein